MPRWIPLAAILLPTLLPAQSPQRIAGPARTTAVYQLSAHPTAPPSLVSEATFRRAPTRRVVLGAVIGAVAGVATCTAISNIIEDEGGFHSCTAKGNVLFGLGGAALGALVAHTTRR
jgi:hypothetical protein